MFVSSTTRIRRSLPFHGAAFGANLADGAIHNGLQLIGIHFRVTRFDILHSAVEDAPADSFLHEFGEVALLHSAGTQEGAQGEVRVF